MSGRTFELNRRDSLFGLRAQARAEIPRVMKLKVQLERETDGRWIGEVPDLPGVLAYGQTRDEALAAVEALALRVVAEKRVSILP
ncbi:MAG: type II toxin-antitoxin system HicB family antitoxin [Candidatus Binataceae bacterium]